MAEQQEQQAQQAEEAKQQEQAQQVQQEPEQVKDKHGQPGINLERHNREMAKQQERIDELEAQLAKAAEDAEALREIRESHQALREEIAAERRTFELERAGCKDLESATAVLANYAGVPELKAAKPWLFDSKPTGSTGLPPAGAPDSDAEALDSLRRAWNIRKPAGK